jgi:membrane fusion protein (multidrug efflux system)
VLRARFHDGRRSELRFDGERMRIGTRGADLLLTDSGVCPLHAELVFRDGVVGVRDLGSRRGTWVDGKRVDRAVLRPGRWFRVGHTNFELVAIEAPQSDASESDALQTRLWAVRGGLGEPRAVPAPVPRRAAPIVAPAVIDVAVGDAPRPRQQRRPPMNDRGGAIARIDAPAPLVVAEADPAARAWLQQALGSELACTWVGTIAEVLAFVGACTSGGGARVVVVIGRRLGDGMPDALAAALAVAPWSGCVTRIVADGVAAHDDGVFYRLRPGLGELQLRHILAAAVRPRPVAIAPPSSATRAWANKVVFDICAAASARPDPAAVAAAIEDGISRLVGCVRVACVFHQASSGALWTEAGPESTTEPIEGRASSGIVGFVARTGAPVMVPIASADARYDRRVDDPAGAGHQSILAVAARSHGEVHAVLVAVREPAQGAFTPRDGEALLHLGNELGPILQRLGTAIDAHCAIERLHRPPMMQLFRPEAIAAQLAKRDEGEVIRIAPAWSQRLYWALLGLLVLGAIGMWTGEVSQYSTGPAVIRQSGRAEVTALGAGAIATIDVGPGQRVRKGQVLARLRDVTERADFDSARNDYDAQLRNRLLDPTDEGAAGQLRLLGRQRDLALAALEQRLVRSPHDGVVTDIGATPGQHVDAGDAVMAVVDDAKADLEVIAFLPGGDRPQIAIGMPLRLELIGFDYAWQDVVVETITEGVVGPNEAKRMLGPQLADTLPLGGGVVMVRARLPTTTFVSGGQTFPYHDGMGGVAEVRMRDETVLEMLIPGFEEL